MAQYDGTVVSIQFGGRSYRFAGDGGGGGADLNRGSFPNGASILLKDAGAYRTSDANVPIEGLPEGYGKSGVIVITEAGSSQTVNYVDDSGQLATWDKDAGKWKKILDEESAVIPKESYEIVAVNPDMDAEIVRSNCIRKGDLVQVSMRIRYSDVGVWTGMDEDTPSGGGIGVWQDMDDEMDGFDEDGYLNYDSIAELATVTGLPEPHAVTDLATSRGDVAAWIDKDGLHLGSADGGSFDVTVTGSYFIKR